MQRAFEKIIERLEEVKCRSKRHYNYGEEASYRNAIEIVNQVASEYGGGWIPCSERLPEEDGFYNVTVKFWHIDKPTVISSHFEDRKWTCVALDPEDKVIAWQPLPPVYEPKEK